MVAPRYLEQHGCPQTPEDLAQHHCIQVEDAAQARGTAWTLAKAARSLEVEIHCRIGLSSHYQVRQAAIDGLGLAYLPLELVQAPLATGQLRPVLESWWRIFPGYHLIYSAKLPMSPGMRRMLSVLSEQG